VTAGAGRLAVIGGHSILGSDFGSRAARTDVDVAGRRVGVLDAGDHVVLQRHGLDTYRPPHLIDHVANLSALAALGCDRALALSSVGGLRAELGVGTVLAPDDFVALGVSVSTFDDARGHRVPSFDVAWRARVVDAWREVDGPGLRDGGVYWQVTGPRFETPAEIRILAAHADVVGMTVASECVVAGELGLAYAAVCVVDNLANGVAPRPLTVEDFEAGSRAGRARVASVLHALVPRLVAS
jgi:5'-methylthioadenosine phosphorylase